MNRRTCNFLAILAIWTVGCNSSPTSPDGEPSPFPAFTARLVTPDTVEFTIDNRASPTPFSMETCNMTRERFEGGEWTKANPLGDLLQCPQGGGSSFPAGEVTTFRKRYVAVGSDGAPERVRTVGLVAMKGVMVLWPDGAVPFFSEPFPGGVKE